MELGSEERVCGVYFIGFRVVILGIFVFGGGRRVLEGFGMETVILSIIRV